MQRDFDLLAVSEADNSCTGRLVGAKQVESLEFDMEKLKARFPAISEEALYFLIAVERVAAARPLSVKAHGTSSLSYVDKFAVKTSLASTCDHLPPPRRFVRAQNGLAKTK